MGKRSRDSDEVSDNMTGYSEEEEEEDEEEEDPREDEPSEGSEESESDSEGSDSSGQDDEEEEGTIDVTFEFFDPKERDFHGLRALLQSYLDGAAYASSELVDAVIKQSTVGTVVKSAEDEDPIGVITALSLQRYKQLESLRQVKDYILQHCNDTKLKASLEEAWNEDGTGLLLSERLMNCPPQVAPPLQQALFDEIEWATEDEPSQALRDSFKLERYIMLSRVYTDPSTASPEATKKGKKRKASAADTVIVYARPEDEFYHQRATWSFTFPTGRTVSKDELQPLRLVMLLTKDQCKQARQQLNQVVGNTAGA